MWAGFANRPAGLQNRPGNRPVCKTGLHKSTIFSAQRLCATFQVLIFADFIQQTLLNPKAQFAQFFNSKTVEEMVRRHIAGTHNYLNEINKVLTVELICSSLLKP